MEAQNKFSIIKQLESKLYQQGFKAPKIQSTQFRYEKVEYTGMICTEDIQENESLMYIPEQLIINTEKVQKIERVRKIVQKYPNIFSKEKNVNFYQENILVLYILLELQQPSNEIMELYIQILDKQVDWIVYWDIKKIQQIDDPSLFTLALFQKDRFETLAKKLVQVAVMQNLSLDVFTIDNIKWAYYHIHTRTFGSKFKLLTMLPYVDLINHNNVNVHYKVNYVSSNQQMQESKCNYQKTYNNQLFAESINKQKQSELTYIQSQYPQIYQQYEQYICMNLNIKLINKITEYLEIQAGPHSKQFLNELLHYIIIKKYFPPEKNICSCDYQEVIDSNIESVELYTQNNQTFTKGDQVYLNYGKYQNKYLLIRYGFCLENNIQDHYKIQINFNQTHKNFCFCYNLNINSDLQEILLLCKIQFWKPEITRSFDEFLQDQTIHASALDFLKKLLQEQINKISSNYFIINKNHILNQSSQDNSTYQDVFCYIYKSSNLDLLKRVYDKLNTL